MVKRLPCDLRRGFGRLLVILAAGLLLAACAGPRPAPPTPQPSPVSDALRRDAAAYAAAFDLSLDEALRRLHAQAAIGDLSADLEQHEADTFAGLWIENQPEYRVVARFTRGGQATLRKYLRDPQRAELASLVEVRSAQFTLAELRSTQARLMGILGDGGFVYRSGIDVIENRVTVAVPDPAAVQAYLEQQDAALAALVAVVYGEGSDLDAPSWATPRPTD